MEIANGNLLYGDCLDVMQEIEAESIDMIFADLPYGSTSCAWDTVIPFDKLWAHYERIITPTGAICLTAVSPFSAVLACSNLKLFKYDWMWQKTRCGNFVSAKYQPLRKHEQVLVFSKAGCTYGSNPYMIYVPQMERAPEATRQRNRYVRNPVVIKSDRLNHVRSGEYRNYTDRDIDMNYPGTVLFFPNVSKPIHPTQKPVELVEYFIRTYTQPGDIVLDNTIGSGTTGVAAFNLGRRWIGIEKDVSIYQMAIERVSQETTQQILMAANNRLHATPGSAAQVQMYN